MWTIYLVIALCVTGTCVSQLMGRTPSVGSAVPQLGNVPAPSFCNRQERQTTFMSCLRGFGMRHMRFFQTLRSSQFCRAQLFDCNEVDRLIKCINALPTNVISNRCWPSMAQVMTDNFHNYNIPCTYEDIARQCQNSAELLPVSRRVNTGQPRQPTNNMFQGFVPWLMMMNMAGPAMFANMAGAYGF